MINNSVLETEAENKIKEAARKIFHRRGFDGARMQEIADEAQINKAMLHYYFRSKDKLFEAVFKEAAMKLFPVVILIIESDLDVDEKIKKLIHNYIDFIIDNPYVPGFVLHELTQNPERMKHFVASNVLMRPQKFFSQIQEGIDSGKYIPIAPLQLMVTIVASCIFPFVAKPMLHTLFGLDQDDFGEFIEQRKEQMTQFILNGLYKK
ncbi:TetR/AcrR family transcriptional regulator [bacterium]|nr:TetR/AcrR family transcriptional regulator [bacterium]